MTDTATTHPMPANLFNLDLDPNLRAKREQRAAAQGLEPCTHCGRGVAPGRGWVTVVIDGGARVVHPDAQVDDHDPGYMGAWLLGSTCAKVIPAAYRAQWHGWGEDEGGEDDGSWLADALNREAEEQALGRPLFPNEY